MTKTELLTLLNSKYYSVEQDDTKWNNTGKVYLGYILLGIPILEKLGEAIWENDIYVWSNGSDYYWKNGEPKGEGYVFRTELQAYIDTKIADGTIQSAIIENADGANKKAIVKIVIIEATVYKEKRLLVLKNASNNFEYHLLS